MMIDPPIDKLIEKVGCKFALVCLVTKRARQLLEINPDILTSGNERVVTMASREVYSGSIEAGYEE